MLTCHSQETPPCDRKFLGTILFSQIEHNLDGVAAMSAHLKGVFNFLLGEPESVVYEGLRVYLATSYELEAERPCVPVPEYADHINLPAGHQSMRE
ncbi:uncharacterized protein J3R85_012677 [Psidium guajava]|nr:uncharacterized protein J3R85_012677 [Psidium guajava]